jgi:hypothetical protein
MSGCLVLGVFGGWVMWDGGAGGIRTLDRPLQAYNGLANRRLQPLGHSSVSADMPDARASRKRQIQITPRPFEGAAISRVFPTTARIPRRAFWAHLPGFLWYRDRMWSAPTGWNAGLAPVGPRPAVRHALQP